MKLFSHLLLVVFILFSLSCENKKTVKDQLSVQVENTVEPVSSSTASSTQEDLYKALQTSMLNSDMETFKKQLEDYKNIDTLFLDGLSKYSESSLSLLARACSINNLEAMKYLIAKGADVNVGGEDGYFTYDALYYAILGGNAEMVKILIDKKADLNAIYTETGITPLILAVLNKKYVMAEILLQAGAKVNGVGNLGFDYVLYPLHDAIRLNDVEMVKILLKYNANINLKDHEGLTALDLAKQMKAKEIIALLTK